MLRGVVREELLATNPCNGIAVEKERRTDEPRTFLELDELARVLEAKCLTPQSRNMIKFSFFSGLRAGEVAGLRWSNVDWTKRVAFVQFSYDGPTKSGKPRSVSLLPQAVEAWEAQRALGLPCESSSAYVFPGRGGECRRHIVLRQLKAACREVGIERNVVALAEAQLLHHHAEEVQPVRREGARRALGHRRHDEVRPRHRRRRRADRPRDDVRAVMAGPTPRGTSVRSLLPIVAIDGPVLVIAVQRGAQECAIVVDDGYMANALMRHAFVVADGTWVSGT